MKKLLTIAALLEVITGLALLVVPAVVVSLLFGSRITDVGAIVCRLGGMGLLALGLACWPSRDEGDRSARSLRAILLYNLLATLYLGYLALNGEWVGPLLWPVVALHATMTVLLARAWITARDGA